MTRLGLLATKLLCLVALATPLSALEPGGDQLDQAVHWILKNKCTVCHDDIGTDAASGVDDLLDLPALFDYYLDPSDEELVNDLVLGQEARMPKPNYDSIVWRGPLTTAEKDTIREWLNRGGTSAEYGQTDKATSRELISIATQVKTVATDLQKLSGKELENARYLTLTNLHNSADVTEEELELYRSAIVKTLNSLSYSPDVLGMDTSNATHKMVAVDDARTIFRFDLRNLKWDSGKWNSVAKFYPFAVDVRDGSAEVVDSLTSSPLPYLRADWFVFATLQPPLYHALLGIPSTQAELEHSLGIDRFAEIRDRNVARAAMIESKVSDYNRLLERIAFRGGAYHLSYDNGSNDGESNFLDFPLGPKGAGLSQRAEFKHDGGEAIFNLPNDYQAYVLVDAKGDRLDIAPSAIVQDGTMPRDAIINGISCLSCHFQGIKPERYSPRLAQLDVVRDSAKNNFFRLNSDERSLIEELYPDHETFEKLLEQDRQRFLVALERSGIPQRGATEPARELFNRFKNDLDTASLASEFGMSVDEFRNRMSRESETRQLLNIADQGAFDRQRVLSQFSRIARLVGLGEVRQSKRLPFPYFAEDTSKFAQNTAVQAAANPTVGYTGIELVDAENRDGQLQLELWTAEQRKSFRLGESLQVRVRASGECFLTLVSVDSEGAMTLLVPNAFQSELKLHHSETITIPTPQMDFEFAAQRPLGPTIVKAIVTKRPLQLSNVTAEKMANEGLASLGRAKGFGVRRRTKPSASNPEATAGVGHLTDQSIEELFSASDWATASITISVRD